MQVPIYQVDAFTDRVLGGNPAAVAPTNLPRTDLATTFLTGIAGVNKPTTATPSEMLRLNTAVPPVPFASQNRLGVAGNALNTDANNDGFISGAELSTQFTATVTQPVFTPRSCNWVCEIRVGSDASN